VDDEQVYLSPADLNQHNGKLLKGFINVVPMNSEETKLWESENL